jgi:hypothetical protein
VEVGDVIHATLLKVCVALPPSTGEGSSVLGRGLLCLTMPSGVKYMDGLGVTNHYAVEEDHDGSLASQPVSIPVPIRAPVSQSSLSHPRLESPSLASNGCTQF